MPTSGVGCREGGTCSQVVVVLQLSLYRRLARFAVREKGVTTTEQSPTLKGTTMM